MYVLIRILGAVALIGMLTGFATGAALAQAVKGPAKYGEIDTPKTPSEIAAEKEAERAYNRSLGNIPAQKSVDPWGTVRSDSAPPKAAAKAVVKPKAKSADVRTDTPAKP